MNTASLFFFWSSASEKEYLDSLFVHQSNNNIVS